VSAFAPFTRRHLDALVPAAGTGALVIGIALGERKPSLAALQLAGAIGLALGWFLRGRGRVVMLLCSALALGAGAAARAVGGLGWPAEVIRPAGRTMVEGVVTYDPNGHPFATRLVVHVDRLGGQVLARRIEVRGSGRESLRLRTLRLGDAVVIEGVIVSLAADDDFLRAQRVVAVLADARLVAVSSAVSPQLAAAEWIRGAIERGARRLPAGDRALLLGFLLGDTRELDRATTAAFRAAGLSHLLAVSGANVAFVLALAGPVLRRVSIVTRVATSGVVVLVFAAATRFEPSVLRASAMAGVVMLARLAGRRVTAGRALSYAVFVLLANDPWLVHSLGFRLSVAATGGIAAFAKPIGDRLRGPTVVRDALGVTLAAEVAVAPLLAVHLGGIPVVAPITNVLAIPVAEPLTVYGLVATGVASVLPSRPATILLAPCQWLLHWVNGVAELGASVPWRIDGRGLVVLAIAGAVVAVLRRRRRTTSIGSP